MPGSNKYEDFNPLYKKLYLTELDGVPKNITFVPKSLLLTRKLQFSSFLQFEIWLSRNLVPWQTITSFHISIYQDFIMILL